MLKALELIKKEPFWITSLAHLAVILFALDVPVFWDMYGQVKTAAYYLENGFGNILPSGQGYSDNGHLPLYPVYLALLFKIFGFKLSVAHLSVFPFLVGTLFQLQKFCRLFFGEIQTLMVLVLTFFVPAFISQGIYFSNEIALVFFSLWLLNALLNEHSSRIAAASVILCLLNLRGIAVCGVLLAYFVFIRKNKNAWYLLCGILAWISWALIHYNLTGWFFSGEEIREFRSLASANGMLRNALACAWKLADLGAIFAWVAVIAVVLRRRTLQPPVTLLLLATLSVILTCIPFTNPVSNRYFLLVHVLLLPAFVQATGFLQKKLRIMVIFSFAVVLFANNGVMYPNRYGNAWDCSLKSLSYFEVRKQLDAYLVQQNIPAKKVEAGFQLYFNEKYYLMNGIDREYTLLSDHEMPVADYVAESNICNNYNAQREQFLAVHYRPLKEFKKNAVYVHLYERIRP